MIYNNNDQKQTDCRILTNKPSSIRLAPAQAGLEVACTGTELELEISSKGFDQA